MKKLFLLLAVILSAVEGSFSQSSSDSAGIKTTVLNYIEGYYNSDGERMAKAISPELSKRIVAKGDNGDYAVQDMGSSLLIYAAKKYKRPADDNKEPFKADIKIFDISYDIATVKVTTNKFKFFDYIHLAKINGEWKIINVLWQKAG